MEKDKGKVMIGIYQCPIEKDIKTVKILYIKRQMRRRSTAIIEK